MLYEFFRFKKYSVWVGSLAVFNPDKFIRNLSEAYHKFNRILSEI